MHELSPDHQVTLNPALVCVIDPAGQDSHFRGGDNRIIPLTDIRNPALLQRLVQKAGCGQVCHLSELIQEFPDHADDIISMLSTMIDAGIAVVAPGINMRNPLHRKLIRDGVFSEHNVKHVESLALAVAGSDHDITREVAAVFGQYNMPTREVTVDNIMSLPDSLDIVVATGDFTDLKLFEAINRFALKHNTPWLLVRQAGFDLAQLGPLFIPGQTACYHCLQQRMGSQRDMPEHYQVFVHAVSAQQQQASLSKPCLLWTSADQQMLIHRAADEIINYFINPIASRLAGRSEYIELPHGDSEIEALLKLPDCPECGSNQAAV